MNAADLNQPVGQALLVIVGAALVVGVPLLLRFAIAKAVLEPIKGVAEGLQAVLARLDELKEQQMKQQTRLDLGTQTFEDVRARLARLEEQVDELRRRA